MLEHGNFQILQHDRVLILELSGTFNLQGAKRAIEELKKACLKLESDFYVVEVAKDFEGATPEVFELANELGRWYETHGCRGRALVFPESFKLEIAKMYEPDLLYGTFNSKVFQDTESARQWIKQLQEQQD